MFSQFRRYGKHNIFVRQVSTLEFEVSIDNGQPVFVHPHKPATWFELVNMGIKANDNQMSLPLDDPNAIPPDEEIPSFDQALYDRHFGGSRATNKTE